MDAFAINGEREGGNDALHALVLEILKQEPTLDYSSPNHDLPDLGGLSYTIYLAASAILYADGGAAEKRKLLKTFVDVFTKGLVK